MAFGVVHGNTIQAYLNAGKVSTANTKGGIAGTGTCIGVGHHRGKGVQHHGQVLRLIQTKQGLLIDGTNGFQYANATRYGNNIGQVNLP